MIEIDDERLAELRNFYPFTDDCLCVGCVTGVALMEFAKARAALAMATDAANKGDLARQAAGGMELRIEQLENALERIRSWGRAYPLTVFPEPDWKRVTEALKAAGLSLDQVSASNMRHVITTVVLIVNEALREPT